jgi:hypothetical protein
MNFVGRALAPPLTAPLAQLSLTEYRYFSMSLIGRLVDDIVICLFVKWFSLKDAAFLDSSMGNRKERKSLKKLYRSRELVLTGDQEVVYANSYWLLIRGLKLRNVKIDLRNVGIWKHGIQKWPLNFLSLEEYYDMDVMGWSEKRKDTGSIITGAELRRFIGSCPNLHHLELIKIKAFTPEIFATFGTRILCFLTSLKVDQVPGSDLFTQDFYDVILGNCRRLVSIDFEFHAFVDFDLM